MLTAFVLMGAVFSACGGAAEPQPAGDAGVIDGYREWPMQVFVEKSQAGHGASSRVYANHIVHNYLVTIAPDGVTDDVSLVRYPKRSVIVKEVLEPGGALRYIAVMQKPEELPEGARLHGGWLWSQRSNARSEDAYKSEDACLSCHDGANDAYFRDGVFVLPDCHHSVTCE